MDNEIKAGDKVRTPRFLTVTIAEVFENGRVAADNGYTEPTHYESQSYEIRGKHIGLNLMQFAAIKKL